MGDRGYYIRVLTIGGNLGKDRVERSMFCVIFESNLASTNKKLVFINFLGLVMNAGVTTAKHSLDIQLFLLCCTL